MMDKEQIIQWAREAGMVVHEGAQDRVLFDMPITDALNRFAKLVRDDYSNKHAQLWLKRIDEAVKAEREAIERVVGVAMLGADHELFKRVLGAIRARGNT